jgi:Delta7-sterol 5-desaturase
MPETISNMLQTRITDQVSENGLLLTVLAAAAFIAARYVLIAGGAMILITLRRTALASRRIQPQPFTRDQLAREGLTSMSSALVFGALVVGAFALHREFSILQIYPDVSDHGWAWFWASIPIALLMHDFYFYWAHRLMHLPALYPVVHSVHHLSTNPSPLAALSFHPLEAAIEVLGILVIAMILPMHPAALSIVALCTILLNVLGHLGYELLPRGFEQSPAGKVLNTATSHNQHHRTFTYNYGLYTLIWDRLFGTVHPGYGKLFARVTSQHAGAPSPSGNSQLET